MKSVLIAASVLLITTASGCSADSPRAQPTSRTPTETHTASAISKPDVRVIRTFHLGQDVEAVSGNAERVVFGSKEAGDQDHGSVISVDLRTGARTVVGHSEFPHGMINWVGATGDWTVYTDQSHVQGDSGMDVLWRVVAVNPTLHKRKVLLSNGNKPDPWVPWLGSSDDYVYWSSAEPDADHTAREWLFHHDWSAPRTLFRHAVLTPGSESIGADGLVYLGASAAHGPGNHVGGDCWQIPFTGGTPTPLTHTGLANGCATDGTWVVWQQLIAPGTTPAPKEGFMDSPYEVWAERLDEQKPELLHRGYTDGGWPLAQNGFAIYADMGGRVVQSLENPRSVIRLRSNGWDLGARVGTRLAFPNRAGKGLSRSVAQDVDIVEVSAGE